MQNKIHDTAIYNLYSYLTLEEFINIYNSFLLDKEKRNIYQHMFKYVDKFYKQIIEKLNVENENFEDYLSTEIILNIDYQYFNVDLSFDAIGIYLTTEETKVFSQFLSYMLNYHIL